MELNPTCDILIPTYNRKKFEKLISNNIRQQIYPNIREVIVLDDGCESQRLELDVPYTVRYLRCDRCTIAEKRNKLIELSKATYCAFFDTDDWYHPERILIQIYMLMQNPHYVVCGSSDMIMTYLADEKDDFPLYMHSCIWNSYMNEATLTFHRKTMSRFKFKATITPEGAHIGEGVSFLKPVNGRLLQIPIDDIMICLCHGENTIPKNNRDSPYENDVTHPMMVEDVRAYLQFDEEGKVV